MSVIGQDLRFGARLLRRNPGFAGVAILTLALGVGANTAVFSVVEAVLLRPLPFKHASQLVLVGEGFPQLGFGGSTFAAPDYAFYANHQRGLESVAAFQNADYELSGGAKPERVTGARVSASLFPLLGASASLGRVFIPDDDQPGRNVAVLSYELWQRLYGGHPEIVGKVVNIDRIPHSVIGVMQKGFKFPLPGLFMNNREAGLWVPLAFAPSDLQSWGGMYNYSVVGRLRRGTSLATARSEMGVLASRIQQNYPATFAEYTHNARLQLSLNPLHDQVVAHVKTLMSLLLAAVVLVFLVACANLATLLLSRALNRQTELAVRSALGAGKLALVRKLLSENLEVALIGGALGWLIAFLSRSWFLSLLPASIPLPNETVLGGPVFVFAMALSLLACLLFGTVPVLLFGRRDLSDALRESGRSLTTSRSARAIGSVFVTVEVALAMILLIGAGLLLRSFDRLLQVNTGFRPSQVLTTLVPLPAQSYPKAAQVRSFYGETLRRLSRIPEIDSVAMASDVPLHVLDTGSFEIEELKTGSGMTPPTVHLTRVLGDYFKALGVPLVHGRGIAPGDRQGTMPVAVVNATMARQFWPGQDVIGKHIQWGGGGPRLTIVGVVGDVKDDGLRETTSPHVYTSYLQEDDAAIAEDPTGELRGMRLVVHSRGGIGQLTKQIENAVHSLDPEVALPDMHAMDNDVRSGLASQRFSVFLVGIFASLALALAAIGVYGVIAFAATQQKRDIGVRMALGASRSKVLQMVLRNGLRLTLAGIVAGLAGAAVLTRFIRSQLYEVGAGDPVTFIAAPTILVLIALLACFLPAYQATKVDPVTALRNE